MNNNLPKAVYIHIPFCKRKCSYCGFYSKSPQEYDVGKLLDAEIAELEKSPVDKPVRTLYIGGGNPSCIGHDLLCGFLKKVLTLTGKPDEFTVEVNPADADEKLIKSLFELGVNRISIGVQSFSDKELAFLGRGYSAAQAQKTIETCKAAGFKNISIDLIFALPPVLSEAEGGSDLQCWRQNLDKAVEMNVTHISAYSLTYEKNTPLEKSKSSGRIKTVDEETDRQMYETAIETLGGAGFNHYEISNFAKPGFECKHNLTYWKNDFYIGIGPAACSYIEHRRIENINDIEKYIIQKDAVAETFEISLQEKACQTAVLGLRLIKGIDLAEYKQKTGFDISELFKVSIENNLKVNLLQIKDNRLSLTKSALSVADSVLCDFSQPD
ncbi:MAG: radical SAM family heme chaperone HemW [Phycisphaerae bacterium]|jgi:oxygen-independent coproporphyrinogen-3 oxidase